MKHVFCEGITNPIVMACQCEYKRYGCQRTQIWIYTCMSSMEASLAQVSLFFVLVCANATLGVPPEVKCWLH